MRGLAVILLASGMLLRGSNDDVIAFLKKQLAVHPADSEASTQLVEMLLDAERLDEAQYAVQNALRVNSGAADVRRAHGDLLVRQGRLADADGEYLAALRLDRNSAPALLGRARILRSTGMRSQAAALIRSAYALDPGDAEIGREFDLLDTSAARLTARWERDLRDGADMVGPDRRAYLETSLARIRALQGRRESDLVSAYRHYEFPYKVTMNGGSPKALGLNVWVNGAKLEVRVDTGASGLSVSSAFATRAGIRPIGTLKLGGIGNNQNADGWIGLAERLQIGDLALRDVVVQVRDGSAVEGSGGLLGTDLFSRFLIRFDFEKRRLELDPLPGFGWDGVAAVDKYQGPELRGFAPLIYVRHYLLIPTQVSDMMRNNKTDSLFLIDSGSSLNNISASLARSVTPVRSDNRMVVKGVAGKVRDVFTADSVLLQFGGFQQPAFHLVAFDLGNFSRSAGMEVGGIIGLPILSQFRSITLDYRDVAIRFDYRPQ